MPLRMVYYEFMNFKHCIFHRIWWNASARGGHWTAGQIHFLWRVYSARMVGLKFDAWIIEQINWTRTGRKLRPTLYYKTPTSTLKLSKTNKSHFIPSWALKLPINCNRVVNCVCVVRLTSPYAWAYNVSVNVSQMGLY